MPQPAVRIFCTPDIIRGQGVVGSPSPPHLVEEVREEEELLYIAPPTNPKLRDICNEQFPPGREERCDRAAD
jgi:hypothetical protein